MSRTRQPEGPRTRAWFVGDAPDFRRRGLWLVLAAAWIDTLTEAHGDMLTATRVALAMGKARELPSWLGAIHEPTKSPRHAVLALGVVGLLWGGEAEIGAIAALSVVLLVIEQRLEQGREAVQAGERCYEHS